MYGVHENHYYGLSFLHMFIRVIRPRKFANFSPQVQQPGFTNLEGKKKGLERLMKRERSN